MVCNDWRSFDVHCACFHHYPGSLGNFQYFGLLTVDKYVLLVFFSGAMSYIVLSKLWYICNVNQCVGGCLKHKYICTIQEVCLLFLVIIAHKNYLHHRESILSIIFQYFMLGMYFLKWNKNLLFVTSMLKLTRGFSRRIFQYSKATFGSGLPQGKWTKNLTCP